MYVCALRPRGEPLSRGDVFGYIARLRRRPDASLHSVVEGPFAAVATTHESDLRPRLARWRDSIGVGDVRLDNRLEVAAIAGVDAAGASDLELVLAAIDRAGEDCVPRILGDFAFVLWDARAQKLLAVRDAFGVKPLYHRTTGELELYASELAPLHVDEEYDVDYIADYLGSHTAAATQTIWRGITAVRAGSLVRHRGTVLSRTRYWSPDAFMPRDEDGDEESNVATFRALFEDAVRTRVAGAGDVWAHLSGGLDSSSVVGVAGSLALPGARLAGTVTVVDTLGEGDERVYSNAVVDRYRVRNEQVIDYWAWQDDGSDDAVADHPYPMLPFHARDRRVHDIVRDAGGRVLLSGMGADHYLHGTLDYITDLTSAGRVRDALREVTTWSVATRQSFWRLGRRYMLDPFLPGQAGAAETPPWLAAPFAARLRSTGMDRTGSSPYATGRFAGRLAAGLEALPSWLERWPWGGDVELRYPFLYRPLVEWSLALPVRQRVRPHARKWVLRQAMRNVLPDAVRTRSTKGGIDARILWSLRRERPRLDAMLRDPVLAQLGCVDGDALRAAVDRAVRGQRVNHVQLFSALSLETWLAARAGLSFARPNSAVHAA
jgi:asparagine synthase (glutamine-hydrolysing)